MITVKANDSQLENKRDPQRDVSWTSSVDLNYF